MGNSNNFSGAACSPDHNQLAKLPNYLKKQTIPPNEKAPHYRVFETNTYVAQIRCLYWQQSHNVGI